MWIGRYRYSQRKLFDLKWKITPEDTVKSLGVCFSNIKPFNVLEENWRGKVDKIKNLIQMWKQRNLTMVGKITIVKSLLASQLSFISSVLNIPDVIVNELNTLFFKFIWGSNEKVKRKTLIANYESGGLKMIHLPSFL
jgi:hypothetical protein